MSTKDDLIFDEEENLINQPYSIRIKNWLNKPMTHNIGPFTTPEHTGWHMVIAFLSLLVFVLVVIFVISYKDNKFTQPFSVSTG